MNKHNIQRLIEVRNRRGNSIDKIKSSYQEGFRMHTLGNQGDQEFVAKHEDFKKMLDLLLSKNRDKKKKREEAMLNKRKAFLDVSTPLASDSLYLSSKTAFLTQGSNKPVAFQSITVEQYQDKLQGLEATIDMHTQQTQEYTR